MFGAANLVLFVLRIELRRFYLYAVSAYLFVTRRQRSTELLFGVVGVVHSFIHLLFPFLHDDGYDFVPSPTPDVMCHALMLAFVIWLRWQRPVPRSFVIISVFLMVGSVFNVALSRYHDAENDFWFRMSSSFQAVSTAWWLAQGLAWPVTDLRVWMRHAAVVSSVILVVWASYLISWDILAVSTRHRFIEGIFIIAPWYPLMLDVTSTKPIKAGKPGKPAKAAKAAKAKKH